MRTISLPFAELVAIAATRGMLGMGAGLLLAEFLPQAQRRIVGCTLLTAGLVSTVPLATDVLSRRSVAAVTEPSEFASYAAAGG